jgi:hypothetical protein
MLLSMFISFLLARKVSSRNYVQLVTILILVVSLVSIVLPLSFPFYALLEATQIPEDGVYVLYFLTFEIRKSFVTMHMHACMHIFIRYFLMFFFHFLFFSLVNFVGAIIGYWIGKSEILEDSSKQRISFLKQTIKEPVKCKGSLSVYFDTFCQL